jgi:hypothetical protein
MTGEGVKKKHRRCFETADETGSRRCSQMPRYRFPRR